MAQTAIAPKPIRSGKSRDPKKVAEVLDDLRRDCNVHAPPGLHGVRLPDGFSVVWTEVDVDTRDMRQGGEVYNIGGGMTLATSAIERLATAAGITWDTQRSGRLDDGLHPYVCSYLAVGSYMGPDGMPIPVSGTNKTDLRDGMPGAEKFRDTRTGEMKTAMLAGQRQHILSIAESKARSRAYRKAFGMRAGPLADVTRPWIVFRVQLTGETDDPRTQKIFEGMIFQNALQARASLYGPPIAPPMMMAAGAGTARLAQFAPAAEVAQLPAHDVEGVVDEDEDEPSHAHAPAARPAHAPIPPPARPAATGGAVWPWEPKKPGDIAKGTPLAQCDDAALERLLTYCEKKAAEGGRYADRDAALAQAAREELATRGETAGDDGRPDSPDAY